MVIGGQAVLDVGCCTDAALSTAEDSGTVTVPPVWMGSTGKAAYDRNIAGISKQSLNTMMFLHTFHTLLVLYAQPRGK
jgi:hypothetical protein